METAQDPHARQPLLTFGPQPQDAAAALILLHGRGGSPEDMLSVYKALGMAEIADIAVLAPRAAGNTWYPHSFLAPLAANQPFLDSALAKIESLVADLIQRGISTHRIGLVGFSQGACLSSEFAARHPRPYGAIMALTGGLIGPPGTPRHYKGSLAGVPVFLGTSDPDPHVPYERVLETRNVLARMGATVDLRSYPGMGHTINQDELDACRRLITRLAAPDPEKNPRKS